MTEPNGDPGARGADGPGERRPGERRLARPPSDRYRSDDGLGDPPAPTGTVGRAFALGSAAAVLSALALTVAGGVFVVTAGLIAIAAVSGWAVSAAVRFGGAGALTASRRVGLAVALALAGVALGQGGLWLYAEYQGGALGPIELLAEVYGPLVPLELAAAAAVAWWSAR
ncbi:MAG TPA: hypothetical protein VLA44_03560 [Clostridia bacterium]|nr:hypothetical protein [Clostridia bacterium]